MVFIAVPFVLALFGAITYLKRRQRLTPRLGALLMFAVVFAVFFGNELSFGSNPGKAILASALVGLLAAGFGYVVTARSMKT